MNIQTFEDKELSQLSYIIWSEETKEAVAIDPERNIERYLEFLSVHKLSLKAITETHIHADFASGATALAQATQAQLMLSGYDNGEVYSYQFPHQKLQDGDSISVNGLSFTVLHTPGHTPEHLSFLLLNEKGEGDTLFSGDFLFIGSLGRPDLIGEDAKLKLAGQLYDSVKNKLTGLVDSVKVLPGHGSGSLCGSGMSKNITSTMQEQRAINPYLRADYEREQFIHDILASVPHFPDYYKRMKLLNSAGAISTSDLPQPKPMTVQEFAKEAVMDGFIIDTRHPLAFGSGHIDTSINLHFPDKLAFWAAYVTDYDKDIYLVLPNDGELTKAIHSLYRVGLDNVKGYLQGGFDAWVNSGEDFNDLQQVSVRFLDDLIDAGEPLKLIDVRAESEWNSGHIKKARHIYLGDFKKKIGNIISDEDEMVFVICGGGYRSSLAASLLKAEGHERVLNVFGGMSAWRAAKLPESK